MQLGHRDRENLWPNRLPGDELVRQHHGHGNALDRVRQDRSIPGILIYIYDDGRFVIRPARGSDADTHHAGLEHQVGTVILEHRRGAVRCLLWKLWHKALESRNERSSSTTTLLSLRSCTIAAAATETEGAAQRRPKPLQYLADRISDRASAAACKKETDRIVRGIISDDQGTRIATGTERAASDHNLPSECDIKLLTFTAPLLVLNAHAGVDRLDCAGGEAGRASALRNAKPDGRAENTHPDSSCWRQR